MTKIDKHFPWNDLTVLAHELDRRNFSAAARDLHLAPKTVSKQVFAPKGV